MKQLYASVLKSRLNTEGAGNSLYSRHVQKIILARHCAVFPTQNSITLEDSSCAPRFPASCVVTSPCNSLSHCQLKLPCWMTALQSQKPPRTSKPNRDCWEFLWLQWRWINQHFGQWWATQQTQLVQFVTQKTLAPDLSKFVVKGGVSFLVCASPIGIWGNWILHRPVKLTKQQTLTFRILSELFQDTWDPDSHEHFHCSDRNRAPGIHCHCPPSDLHTYT